MKVKMFQALGKNEIEQLERKINDWLKDPKIQVHHTDSAAAGVSEPGGSTETRQTLIVSVWYEITN